MVNIRSGAFAATIDYATLRPEGFNISVMSVRIKASILGSRRLWVWLLEKKICVHLSRCSTRTLDDLYPTISWSLPPTRSHELFSYLWSSPNWRCVNCIMGLGFTTIHSKLRVFPRESLGIRSSVRFTRVTVGIQRCSAALGDHAILCPYFSSPATSGVYIRALTGSGNS